jgi:hypothetical protein
MLHPLTKLALFCTLLLTLMFSSQATAPAQAQTFSCSNVTEIPQAECNELVTVYHSTNGVIWK